MDDIEIESVVVVLALLLIIARKKISTQPTQRKRVCRRWWVHPMLQSREHHGYTTSLLPILQREDPALYKNFLRMSHENFSELLQLISPAIKKEDSRLRKAIPVETRLHITLRCLATGESFSSLSFQFRVGRTTIGLIVRNTCEAIWKFLSKSHVKFPSTPNDWQTISEQFKSKWNLPHCLGAIDGKHVRIKCPANSGSVNYNYKNYFSKVLFAVAGADYRFIYVDVGNYESEGDSGILSKSRFGQALNRHTLKLPAPCNLPRSQVVSSYYFVGDQAFPLRPDLMRPFKGENITNKQKVFNYRMCRARRVVENAFGILANRFRIFHAPLPASLEKTNEFIVLAAVALHNYLIDKKCTVYCPHNYVDTEDSNNDHMPRDGLWREECMANSGFIPHQLIGSANYARSAAKARDTLADYLSSDVGSVVWQDIAITRGYYS